MSGTPKPTILLSSTYYGIAYSWLNHGPVWRRSRHSTQMLGATPETASALTEDGCRRRDGCPHKYGVTRANTLTDGGRTAASLSPNLDGAC